MLSLILSLALVLGLQGPDPSPLVGSPADPPVLRVNGEEIPRSTYRDWLLQQRGEFLLEAFVLHRRTLALAAAEGVLVPDEEIDAVLRREIEARVAGAFDGDRARWVEELEAAGRSVAGRVRERRIDLEVDRNLAAIAAHRHPIPEETLRAEWERLHGEGGRRLRARMLYRRFVQRSVPGETRDERRARREREQAELRDAVLAIRARVQAGEDFVALVRTLSEDVATRARDGLVADGLDLRGWSREAVDAIASLDEGEVSAPLFAKGGFWLVRSEGWTETPFEDVRDGLAEQLRARGPASDLLANLRAELVAGAREAARPAFLRGGPPDEVVLDLDGAPVTRAAFEAFCAHYRGEHYLHRFAENWILLGEAREHDLMPSAEELAARVDESIRRSIEFKHGGDHEAWLAQLRGVGRTEASYRRELADRELEWLILERLLRRERAPSEAELRTLWEREYGPGGRRIAARWIRRDVVRPDLPPDADPEAVRVALERARAAARSEIEAVLARLAAGEDFGALAREFSDDEATAARGGEPAADFVLEDWILDPDGLFGEVEAGRLVGPLQFEFAAWVFELLEVRRVPFDDVRDDLRERARTSRPDELVLLEFRREHVGDPVVEALPALAED